MQDDPVGQLNQKIPTESKFPVQVQTSRNSGTLFLTGTNESIKGSEFY